MTPIADGHADSLMWNRDLTARQRRGRLDFPRLVEAGVRLQCFTVVTRGYPVVDGIGALAAVRRWPAPARAGPWARCLFQLDRMRDLCGRSGGLVRVAASAEALEAALAEGRIAAVLGVEGAHALEGRPERVAELAARGVRFMGLTHLSNNALGGSSSPLMGDRPLFRDEASFRKLYEERLPYYRQADYRVESGGEPMRVVERILALGIFGRSAHTHAGGNLPGAPVA